MVVMVGHGGVLRLPVRIPQCGHTVWENTTATRVAETNKQPTNQPNKQTNKRAAIFLHQKRVFFLCALR